MTDLLVSSGLATSRRQAREFVSSGAVQLNGSVVREADQTINADLALHDRFMLLRRGKKNFSLGCLNPGS